MTTISNTEENARSEIADLLYQKFNLKNEYYIDDGMVFQSRPSDGALHKWLNEKFIRMATVTDTVVLKTIKQIK